MDNTANKYVTLFYQNNSYDWLDGYSQLYGGGFIWRRTLSSLADIFRFSSAPTVLPTTPQSLTPADSTQRTQHQPMAPADSTLRPPMAP